MSTANLLKLIFLAAIWGASFLFMRIAAPVLGPVWLVATRLGLAAVLLSGFSLWTGNRLNIRRDWKHFALIGLFNSALPFLLFAYAAGTVSASVLSVLNATAAIWGALIVAVLTRTSVSLKTMGGLALGVAGVSVLVGLDASHLNLASALAIAAGLGAAFCYGLASYFAKSAKGIDPMSNAHGSLWAATLMLLPGVPFFPGDTHPSLIVIGAAVMLGLVCSGIAYLLYFQLIKDIGAAPSLSVAFLIPVFGVLWGALILGEHVGINTFVGTGLVLSATALVTNFNPSVLFARAKTAT